jgi:conjugal transfer pilus assembly protein TraE
MRLFEFRKSWSQAIRENANKNLLSVALSLICLVVSIGWLLTDRTVVLVPPLMDERMEVSLQRASEGYKKAWALTIAQLTGNVTPSNADLVLETLGDLLSPDAYRKIAASLASQVADIKRDSLVVSFEPRQVMYERASGKVFVTGSFRSQGVSGSPIKAVRTYEIVVDIRLGRPWVTRFSPYEGMPVTAESAKEVVPATVQKSAGGGL